MSEQANNIAQMVAYIVEPLLDHPEELEIISNFDISENHILIEISVNDEDCGKVIGRQGRVIKALRTLTRAACAGTGERVDIELLD